MLDYKSNSHKSKENIDIPEKKIEKVVSGKVLTKKKSLLVKIVELFLPEDVTDLKTYFVQDIAVPHAKKIVSEFIDMALYGSSGGSNRQTTASKISYRSYYDEKNKPSKPVSRTRVEYDYSNIILESRGEAEEVLARLDELVDKYGLASVADLNELVGISGEYTDNKYGWTDVRNAMVVRTRDGYLIKMPKAMPLD